MTKIQELRKMCTVTLLIISSIWALVLTGRFMQVNDWPELINIGLFATVLTLIMAIAISMMYSDDYKKG